MTRWLRKNSDLIVILAVAMGSVIIGRLCIQSGVDWYKLTLSVPPVTPSVEFFSAAWNVVYVLCAAAAVILVRGYQHTYSFRRIIGLLLIIVLLNAAWPYLFFVHKNIFGALLDAMCLELSLLLIVALTWRDARVIALVLVPCAAWQTSVLYLNYLIYLMN